MNHPTYDYFGKKFVIVMPSIFTRKIYASYGLVGSPAFQRLLPDGSLPILVEEYGLEMKTNPSGLKNYVSTRYFMHPEYPWPGVLLQLLKEDYNRCHDRAPGAFLKMPGPPMMPIEDYPILFHSCNPDSYYARLLRPMEKEREKAGVS